ncbi:hypothetical protein PPYR_01601 [Photinus pyralis]|uniref:Ig-like domain-containing protein n=1 Tax=Photinus pyralis TaxID=7054 RepID=A0A5N4B4U1_PHOPY|nr:hypothetical protein PPYR_01601 [Photinus pyralis]
MGTFSFWFLSNTTQFSHLTCKLDLKVSRSNAQEVTLTNVERETSGEFKCEVSADAPLFHTEIRAAHLLVADIPDDGPVLTTQLQKVAPGAKIKANCTSPPAYPAVNITWFVNDVEVISKFGIHIQRFTERYNLAIPQLETVHSVIAIKAVPDIFKNGKLKLRCLATMFTLYRRTEELEVQEDAPLLALIMVPTTQSSEGKAGLHCEYCFETHSLNL